METRKLRLEWLDPKQLKENPNNWRRHGGAQTLALKSVLAEVGWAGTLLLNERTGRLIDGHLRKKIARSGEKVPVLIGSWTEEEEKKILASFDTIGSMAETDRTALENLIASIQFESSALGSLLEEFAGEASFQMFEPDELKEPADQVERADELQKKWGTATGQLWRGGLQSLICGDARDDGLVKRLLAGTNRRFREIICDPPYGTSYSEKTAWMQKHGGQRKRAPIENDALKPKEMRKLFADVLRVGAEHAEPGASMYATVPSGTLLPYFIAAVEDSGFSYKHSLVWLKNGMVMGRGDYHYKHESILYAWLENGPHYFIADRTQSSVLEFDRPQASPLHPTTKPVALIARLVMNSSRKGECVYDPFCGSGTTLVASEQLERIGFGVELDPRFVAVGLERLSSLGAKMRLIEGPRR